MSRNASTKRGRTISLRPYLFDGFWLALCEIRCTNHRRCSLPRHKGPRAGKGVRYSLSGHSVSRPGKGVGLIIFVLLLHKLEGKNSVLLHGGYRGDRHTQGERLCHILSVCCIVLMRHVSTTVQEAIIRLTK